MNRAASLGSPCRKKSRPPRRSVRPTLATCLPGGSNTDTFGAQPTRRRTSTPSAGPEPFAVKACTRTSCRVTAGKPHARRFVDPLPVDKSSRATGTTRRVSRSTRVPTSTRPTTMQNEGFRPRLPGTRSERSLPRAVKAAGQDPDPLLRLGSRCVVQVLPTAWGRRAGGAPVPKWISTMRSVHHATPLHPGLLARAVVRDGRGANGGLSRIQRSNGYAVRYLRTPRGTTPRPTSIGSRSPDYSSYGNAPKGDICGASVWPGPTYGTPISTRRQSGDCAPTARSTNDHGQHSRTDFRYDAVVMTRDLDLSGPRRGVLSKLYFARMWSNRWEMRRGVREDPSSSRRAAARGGGTHLGAARSRDGRELSGRSVATRATWAPTPNERRGDGDVSTTPTKRFGRSRCSRARDSLPPLDGIYASVGLSAPVG